MAEQALEEQVGVTPLALHKETQASKSNTEVRDIAIQKPDFITQDVTNGAH